MDRSLPCLFQFYCGAERARSSEHVMFASLGGLRECRNIWCTSCQGTTGRILQPLVEDVADLAAQAGVRNVHSGPRKGTALDPSTGDKYVITDGGKIFYPHVRELVDEPRDGVRHREIVCSTQKQRDEFVRTVKAEGKPYEIVDTGKRPMYFVRPLQIRPEFGGDAAFRGLGVLALNFLAKGFPTEARHPSLEPFKRFVLGLDGGVVDPVDFDYEWQKGFPPNRFRFGHRVAVGIGTDGEVVAGISLFGIYDVSVRLGVVEPRIPVTRTVDIDPLATEFPNDVHAHPDEAQGFSATRTPGAAAAERASERILVFTKSVADRLWERDEAAVMASVNAVRATEAAERCRTLAEVLQPQLQRILNVSTDTARRLEHQAKLIGAGAPSLVHMLATAFEANHHDLTGRAEALLMMIRDDIIECIAKDLEVGPITGKRLREYLEGHRGRMAAERAFVTVVEVVTQQLRRRAAATSLA